MSSADQSSCWFPEDHAAEILSCPAADGVLQVLDDGERRWLKYRYGTLQSAMHKGRHERLVLAYTRAMASVLLFAPRPRDILILGLGGGSLVRFLLHHYPDARLRVVEREPACVTIAQEFFSLPIEDPRLEIIQADVRDVVPGLRDRFDLVLLDLFLAHGPPSWLSLPDLFADCRERMTEGGALSANLWIDPEDEALTSLRGVSRAFGDNLLLIPVAGYRNTIALAFGGRFRPPELKTLRRRATTASGRFGFDVHGWLRVLETANGLENACRAV